MAGSDPSSSSNKGRDADRDVREIALYGVMCLVLVLWAFAELTDRASLSLLCAGAVMGHLFTAMSLKPWPVRKNNKD